jgi:Ca2+-binding RTX toxin-like protein
MVDIAGNQTTTAIFEYPDHAGTPLFGSFSGQFETEGDADWIAVTLIGGQTYSFFGSSNGTQHDDSVMRLINSAGQEVAYNDDGGITSNSYFTFVVPGGSTETYYLEMRNFANELGEYSAFFAIGTDTIHELNSTDNKFTGIAAGRILGGAGNDTITLGAADKALGEQGNDQLTGNANNNEISGGLGNDSIDGNAGNDQLFGDAGNDVITGGDQYDVLLGGAGDDKLDGGANDDFLFGGIGNDVLVGGGGTDRLNGGEGADTLDGRSGPDVFSGGNGNDLYLIRNATQSASELYSTGLDRVLASVNFSLADTIHAKGAIENLSLFGSAASATGNGLANVIIGNALANKLTGLAGKDTLVGAGGNDSFVYKTAADSHGATADVITDFDDNGNDRIDLSALFAGTLVYKGTGALTGAHQVHIHDIAGPDLLVEVNLSGSLAPELTIRLAATTALSMSASDFVL